MELLTTIASHGFVGGLSIFCGVIWGAISDRLGRNKGAALACLVLGLSYIIEDLVKSA
jgi:hypothetical protein